VAARERYDADQIQVLEGLDPVRKRPGMYVGGTSARGLHHLVWEVVDNSVDEALAGHCREIVVELDADGVVSVTDDGRGIPVGVHRETGVSALELVFTRLHAGGKFGGGGYKVSGGLHGVGASVTNALSEWLEVEVRRQGQLWRQRYERGVRTGEVEAVRKLKRGEGTGTTVRWRFDAEIFDRGVTYAPATIAARLKEKAYLVRGLTFRLRTPGHDEQVFRSERGLADYVRDLNEAREPAHATIVSLVSDPGAEVPCEIALQWTQTAEERVYGFCNVVNTVDGGTHVSGLRAAVTRALNVAAQESGRLKRDRGESLEPKDVFEGVTAAVSVMLADPQFEGQTKGRLNNAEAKGAVQSFAYAGLAAWLARKENARETRAILDRVLLSREIRIARTKISKKLRNAATSIFSDSNLPGKLADTLDNPNVPIEERELFIVEGDSAGGSAKGARDANTQAILPIRGKILNVLGARNGRAFENAEVDAILVALGGRKDVIGKAVVATLDAEQRRYGRVVILADADADGAHIANLLVTIFHELFPRLLREGRLFLARPPLFRVMLADGSSAYGWSDDELRAILKRTRRTGDHVTRFKGLGEMNPEQLRETAFDPATRQLVQVGVEDAAHVAETVSLLMGNDPSARRAWLEGVAAGAEVPV
jgi:DNA gyrase subunit B